MAGKGIEIDIAANTRDFQRGTKDVEAALEGVADALDDVSKDAAKSGDKIGDELSDGTKDGARKAERAVDGISDALTDAGRDAKRAGDKIGDGIEAGAEDAERSVEKLEQSFKDVADASKRETNRASDAMKRNMDEGTTAAKRDLGELKDEAISNASETFSSFDGSITSLADGIQGTLGGVISNIGPAGAVAGAAAAIGVGLLTAEFERTKERAEEVRQQAAELARQIIDAGGDIRNVAMAETLQDWAMELSGTSEVWDVFGDKGQTNLEAIQGASKLAGRSVEDMMRALSGRDQELAVEILGDLEDKLGDVEGELNNLAQARAGGTERAAELREEQSALEDGIQVLEERSGVTKEGIETAKLLAEATAQQAAEDEAAAAATEARTDAMSALQGELDSAVDAWSEYIDAETGAVDPGAYIAGMQARMDATSNFNSNVQSMATEFGLSTEEVQAILDQGVDFAPMLQAIVDSGMAPEFVAQVQAAVGGGQEILDGTPLGTTVTADADVGKAQAELEGTAEDRNTTVHADADTKSASNELDRTASKKRTAKINAQANTGTAERELTRAARARNARITADASVWNAESQLERLTRTRYMTIVAEVEERRGRSFR